MTWTKVEFPWMSSIEVTEACNYYGIMCHWKKSCYSLSSNNFLLIRQLPWAIILNWCLMKIPFIDLISYFAFKKLDRVPGIAQDSGSWQLKTNKQVSSIPNFNPLPSVLHQLYVIENCFLSSMLFLLFLSSSSGNFPNTILHNFDTLIFISQKWNDPLFLAFSYISANYSHV